MFKRDFFEDTKFTLEHGPSLQSWLETCYVCTTIDPAIGKEKDACHAVVVTVAWDERGHGWVLDLFRQKGVQPDDLLEEIYRHDRLWAPKAVGLETRGFQSIYIYNAREKSRDTGQYPPWVPLKDSKVSKDLRIAGLEPLARMKRIHWQDKHYALIEEFCSYPRGKYKDAIDAMAYQIELAIRGRAIKPAWDDLPDEARKKAIDEDRWKKKLANLHISGYSGRTRDWYNI